MEAYNPKNERIKKRYYHFLKEADQKAESTINAIRKAISRFETYTGMKDFGTFNEDQAVGFKKHLSSLKTERTGEPLSTSTILHTVNTLKECFKWLSEQQGYKSRIHRPDIKFLSLSAKETRAAKAPKYRNFPTLEQIHRAILAMPTTTDIERRDRALLACAIVSGARDSALISLKIKHIDLERRHVIQDPTEVKTKASKRIDTWFFPVGDDLQQIVIDWVKHLKENKYYGFNDPLFPRTRLVHDATQSFKVGGLEPISWQNTSPARRIFRNAFEAVDLPYFNPHSFRKTLVQLGEQICKTPEEFKAWSQNLGHEGVLTTFTSYGRVDTHRQGEIIRRLGEKGGENGDVKRLLREVMERL
jgi:integrase/recombinase XerD